MQFLRVGFQYPNWMRSTLHRRRTKFRKTDPSRIRQPGMESKAEEGIFKRVIA